MSGTTGTLPPPNTNTASDHNELYRWLYLAYRAIISATSGTSGPGFGSPGVTSNNEAIVAGDHRNLDYLDLSQLLLNGDNVASTAAEINQLHGSNITRNVLTGLQRFSLGSFYFEFSIAAEVANMIAVTVVFKDSSDSMGGKPVTATMWLSDDPQGLNFTATAPSTSVTAATGALFDAAGTKKVFQGITDTTGTIVIDITDTTTSTWYLCVATGFNTYQVSDAITFS